MVQKNLRCIASMLWTTALVLLPSCLRQRPKRTLLSCFNAIYNFYSFILPCEVREQIPFIVIAFLYLKYSHSLSRLPQNYIPCLEQRGTSETIHFYQCLSHGKIGLEAVFNDFLDRSINDVYHIWSPLLEFCKDINPCFW